VFVLASLAGAFSRRDAWTPQSADTVLPDAGPIARFELPKAQRSGPLGGLYGMLWCRLVSAGALIGVAVSMLYSLRNEYNVDTSHARLTLLFTSAL
jgi:hypothetical protein